MMLRKTSIQETVFELFPKQLQVVDIPLASTDPKAIVKTNNNNPPKTKP